MRDCERCHPAFGGGAFSQEILPSPVFDTESAASFVLDSVARHFGVSPGAILARSRGTARASQARQVVAYLCRTAIEWSAEETARWLSRHRTTIAHACRRIEDCRDCRTFDAWLGDVEKAVSRHVAGLGRAVS